MGVAMHIDFNEIDDEMVPLIKVLNEYGIKTMACCSGHGKYGHLAYIAINLSSLRMTRVENDMLCIEWLLSNNIKVSPKGKPGR